jgi:hypothetical protein
VRQGLDNGQTVLTRSEVARLMDEMTKEAVQKYGLQGKGKGPVTRRGKKWQRRWTPSPYFVLCTVRLDKVEQPLRPKSGKVVLAKMERFDRRPIFVDRNVPLQTTWTEQKAGRKLDTLVVDGKHRVEAARILGMKKIKAWVGVQALTHFEDPDSRGFWWFERHMPG